MQKTEQTATLISITKPIAASPTEIFKAWTDPETIGNWLFRTPTGELIRSEIDPQVGGKFTIVEKRGDNLAEHFGKFTALEPGKRIAFDFHAGGAPSTHIEITLQSTIYGTSLTFEHNLDPGWIEFKEQSTKGWKTVLEGLSNALTQDRNFTVTKQLKTPRHEVFFALMDAKTLPRWFVCETMSMPTVEMDVREGGKYRLEMKMDAHQFAFIGEYLEIVSDSKYVFTQIYDVPPYNNAGAIVTTEVFENDGGTLLTERIDFPNQTTFDGAAATGMESGMDATLDRFVAFIDGNKTH